MATNLQEPATSMNGLTLAQKHEAWYELFQQNCLKGGGERRRIPAGDYSKNLRAKNYGFIA